MDKSRKQALQNQLLSIRTSIDAVLFLIQEEEDQGCKHPAEYRKNLTTMGGPEKWICTLCGFEFEEGDE